jgi:cardiolipin synthase
VQYLPLVGIELYEYQPALLHAKTTVVDGTWALIGTTNLDNPSFALSGEINLIVHDFAIGGELQQTCYEDLKHSKLTYEGWKSRHWREKLFKLFTIPIKEQL